MNIKEYETNYKEKPYTHADLALPSFMIINPPRQSALEIKEEGDQRKYGYSIPCSLIDPTGKQLDFKSRSLAAKFLGINTHCIDFLVGKGNKINGYEVI